MTEIPKPLDERTFLKVLTLSKHFPNRPSKKSRKVIEVFDNLVEIVKRLDEVGEVR